MANYIRFFTEKCAHKIKNQSLFNYISLTDIILYTIRQGYHLYKKTFTQYLNSYRKIGPEEAIMITPYGSIYLPSQLDDIAISYLLTYLENPSINTTGINMTLR